MNPALRVITELPLRELWSREGVVEAEPVRDVGAEEIRDLLRAGRVQFLVAEVGATPRWVPPAECHEFWKGELQPHLAEPGAPAGLEEFPGEYCYFAREWAANVPGLPIVVCEKCH